MSQGQTLAGEAHSRFVCVATLLFLIDPVRGEPTVHSLDRHPHDDIGKFDYLQKKFLDSFALICSTSGKGGETASAICLERGNAGTVLRLARNNGTDTDLIDRLQEVLDDLSDIATNPSLAKAKEDDIIYKVIDLTKDKLRSILLKLCKADTLNLAEKSIRKMEENDSFFADLEGMDFKNWIHNLPVLLSLTPQTEVAELIPHVKWASQARWVYAEHIEALICPDGQDLPSWVNSIYKLGRYFAAVKAMVKLAIKQSFLFTPIHIEAVEAPEQESFSLGKNRSGLEMVIQRLTEIDHEQLMSQLGTIWLTGDPELHFRQTCRLKLTVHAEMQLLSFYDHNPDLVPTLLFMGTSKKACYLCHKFMNRHPLSMSVSASHQKIYPSWMPAPCSTSSVRKKHKVLLWELSRHLEQTTARDLETRLGIRRRKNLDSTAGPSLTTSVSVSSTQWVIDLPVHTRRE